MKTVLLFLMISMLTYMEFKTRDLYPNELRVLKRMKTQAEKKGKSKYKFYHFVLLGVLGTISAYIATHIHKDSFWLFLFGTIAVFSFGFVIFVPFELYKAQKLNEDFLQNLNALIEKQTVDTCRINATRIAIAKEYDDESDLYIVEIDKDNVLYLHDLEYNLKRNFPCLQFEIYENDFFKLTGKVIYPLSDKITPITIDRIKKMNYMKQFGIPEHLGTEKISFDELITKFEA